MKTAKQKKMGRPQKRVFINVEVLAKTRDALRELKHASGLSTQGDVLDHMVADVMRRKPK